MVWLTKTATLKLREKEEEVSIKEILALRLICHLYV
jgi:hypothetical protein